MISIHHAHAADLSRRSSAESEEAARFETEHKQRRRESRSREDRIRAAFRLNRDQALPPVNRATLRAYHQYLASQLSFPFRARYYSDAKGMVREATVVGLFTPRKSEEDVSTGLLCLARDGKDTLELPLVELELAETDSNFQLVDDYWYWFWNWQHYASSASAAIAKRSPIGGWL